jgi:hypothetical protein
LELSIDRRADFAEPAGIRKCGLSPRQIGLSENALLKGDCKDKAFISQAGLKTLIQEAHNEPDDPYLSSDYLTPLRLRPIDIDVLSRKL